MLAHPVHLARDAHAVLVDKKQRDQHEQHQQEQPEQTACGRQNRARNVANVLTRKHLDPRTQRVRLAQVFAPQFGQRRAHERQRLDPRGHCGAMAVGLDRPVHEFAGFADGVVQRHRQRYHEHHQHHQNCQTGRQRGVAAAATHQAAVQRPGGETDDQRGQRRDQKAVEKIDTSGEDQQQQAAGDEGSTQDRRHRFILTWGAARAGPRRARSQPARSPRRHASAPPAEAPGSPAPAAGRCRTAGPGRPAAPPR
ncbi:hypothetical protein FQZ97_946350 [compost metagenome]